MPRPKSDHLESTDRILDAARVLFAEHGYSGASVRDIARAADVDPAIVVRRFGSKDQLFIRTMQFDPQVSPLFEGELGDLGSRLVESILQRTEGFPPQAFLALMGDAERPEVRAHLRDIVEKRLVAPIAGRLTGPNARLRAALIVSQILGLQNALWGTQDPDVTGASRKALSRVAGAGIQALIDLDGSAPLPENRA